MRSKITIMNMALALSGQPGKEITEGSTGPEFTILDRWYDEVVGEAFEEGDYNFGTVKVSLTTRSAGDFGFDDKWLLPADVLHIKHAYITSGTSDFERDDWESDGTYLYINATANVSIEYVKAGQEHTWSNKFARGIALMLASILKEGLNEEYEEARDTEDRAMEALSKAGALASAQRGPRRPFREGFLIRSRRYGKQRFRYRGQT